MPHRLRDGGRFVTGMHHTIGAFLIISGAVTIPVRRFHQFLERFRIALAQQITGPLPAEIRARWVTPWRAMERLIAGEEIQEHRRLIERPFRLALASEDPAKQFLGLVTVKEMLLIRGPLIRVAR